ncbi:MAG: (d)CMP kinase [Cyclobacteriaceae bacterium]
MRKGIVIAIDGYSGTGKSTTAKRVAAELGYIYVDTGAMYRAVTLAFIRGSVDVSLPENVEAALADIKIKFVLNEEQGEQETYLNDENVESEIRGITVSGKVSEVSSVSAVRRQLVAQQRAMGEVGGIVMDGRDIGTVVFPEAELKIFMTASDEIRAERRWNELSGQGKSVSKEEVLHNLRSRDEIDTSRADSPLRKADDAIVIDTSNITIEQQVKDILKLAKGNLDRDI